jgi:hypothetical protein
VSWLIVASPCVYQRPGAVRLLCAGTVVRTDVVAGRGSSWHRIPWCGPLARGGQTVLICAFLAPSDGTVPVGVTAPQLHRRAAGRCDHHALLAGARRSAVSAAWCSAPTCGEYWLARITLGHTRATPAALAAARPTAKHRALLSSASSIAPIAQTRPIADRAAFGVRPQQPKAPPAASIGQR